MAREFVWHTAINGVRDGSDESISLYSGPGTVWRVIGTLFGGSDDVVSDPGATFGYTVSVGPTAADPVAMGLDPPGVLLHAGATAVVTAEASTHTTPVQVELESEGRRRIELGDQVWLRLRSLSGGTLWFWTWSIRVLILLPEA